MRGEGGWHEGDMATTAWLVLVMLVKDKRGQRLALMWRGAGMQRGCRVGLSPS